MDFECPARTVKEEVLQGAIVTAVIARLKNKAKETGKPFQLHWQLYGTARTVV